MSFPTLNMETVEYHINPNPWLGTFLNHPKSSIALLETYPYLQNAPCIFVDL